VTSTPSAIFKHIYTILSEIRAEQFLPRREGVEEREGAGGGRGEK
jgi:hypothetical protein